MSTTTCNYDHPWNSCPKCGVGICPKHMTEWLNHPPHASPEQPAPEGDGEWRAERVSNLETVIRNQHGTKIGLFVEQKHAEQAVTDHARAALVPVLVEALKQCKTELECSMMTDGRDAAIRASGGALAAARKAGVE